MAIKVKHEGNVTSRVVAANMGGQAESSQKQALAMAQKAASEFSAGNRQLQGARTSAPHAPTSSAQLTHASPGHVSSPAYKTPTPTRKYLGEAVYKGQMLGGGGAIPPTFVGGQMPPDGATGYDAERGEYYRDYAPGEYEREQAAAAERQKLDAYAGRIAVKNKIETDADNARYDDLNRRYGVDSGVRLSDKDYEDLAAGRTKWGYSQRDQQAVDKINQSYEDSVRSGSFDADELARLREESDAKIAAYRKGVQPNKDPLTAEQIYNGAFKGPDGTLYVADGKGGISPIKGTEPQREVETPAERNARVAQERKDKWLDSRIAAIMKDNNGGMDEAGNEIPAMDYQTAYDQAMKEMAVRFPSAPSVQTAKPSVAGATPAPVTDPKKKWSQFAD